MTDLLVAGGGPAGLVTALYARRAGLTVTVVEARAVPIDKACGEGLMPGAVRALTDLGIDPDTDLGGRPFRGIRYRGAVATAVADFAGAPGRGVPRRNLHAALWRAAERAGVDLTPGRIDEVQQDGSAVAAGGHRARYLVAADGLHSRLRREVGLAQGAGRDHRWGQRAHYAVRPWTDRVEVHWAPDAEAYVTPLGTDCMGIALLTRRRAPFAELLAGFPELRARLPDLPEGRVRAAGPLRQRVRGRVAGRVLLVGDAAGYVDALTGEGLAISFAAARALVGRVLSGDVTGYDADYLRVTRRYRLLTSALVAGTRRPAARRAIVPVAQRAPWLFRAAVRRLAG